jgi:tight adherence protein C
LKRDTELGTSHSEALARLQERIGLPGSDAALEAIIQALTLGTPVERVLREQSKRMRENLILEGEQFANTLSVKLLAPLFLFILPASFLVILSPVIVALLEYQSW